MENVNPRPESSPLPQLRKRDSRRPSTSGLRQRLARNNAAVLLGLAFFVLITLGWFQLQFGFINVGQEFGTYGHYNRVLRVTRGSPGYQVVSSQLTRKLDWRNVGQLERFSVGIRDARGRSASVEFVRGSPEMNERDPEHLRAIIQAKFQAELSRAHTREP